MTNSNNNMANKKCQNKSIYNELRAHSKMYGLKISHNSLLIYYDRADTKHMYSYL